MTGRWGWEQALKAATRKVCKLVALGEPGERLPTAGLMNDYLPHDGWQDRVIELVDASKMVIMRAGVSDSVMWEIGTVVPRVDPEMMLIYVSPKSGLWKDLGVSPKAREPERAEYYDEFRDRAAGLFPKRLPPELGRSRFVRFESDWTPVAHAKAWYGWDRPPAIRVANYMESVAVVDARSRKRHCVAGACSGLHTITTRCEWATTAVDTLPPKSRLKPDRPWVDITTVPSSAAKSTMARASSGMCSTSKSASTPKLDANLRATRAA